MVNYPSVLHEVMVMKCILPTTRKWSRYLTKRVYPRFSVIAISSNIDEGEVAVFELAATGDQSQPLKRIRKCR